MTVHDARLKQRHTLAEHLAYVSPAILMNDVLAEIAGTGRSRYEDFFYQVDNFHPKWQNFIISRAKMERMLKIEYYDLFPRFHYLENQNTGSSFRIAWGMTGICISAFMLAGFALCGFHRCRVT
ncbi:MAG: DUF3526 domain-containing protein [Proteobacteria bacterium]|nr:DUF3526 domain-containing protein [Pseudomonadota bacterium]